MNRKTAAGIVAKEASAWTIVDNKGDLLVWTTSPKRIDAIKCRLNMLGARYAGEPSDTQVEEFWKLNTPPAEDVVQVKVMALLN